MNDAQVSTIIRIAVRKRDAIRALEQWILACRRARIKHTEILRLINEAGWAEQFGSHLDLARYHIELSTIKRASNHKSPKRPETAAPQIQPSLSQATISPAHFAKPRLLTPATISNPQHVKSTPVYVRDVFQDAFADVIPIYPRKGDGQ